MKGLMVKVSACVILAAMLGACSTTGVSDSTTAVPAGSTTTGTVIDNSNNNAGSGTVVSAPPSNVTPKHFVVQLIASSSSQKAQGIQREFTSEGYQAYISPIVVAGQTLHRVQIGPYGSEANAYSVLQSMRKRYQSNRYVNAAVVKTVNGS